MSGKSQVIAIGKRVISLIRQKCLLKYGAGTCSEKQIRKLTQFEDLQRCFKARVAIQKYRMFCKIQQYNSQWFKHVKILSELQAGNCGEMSFLTFIILCKIVPPGIKVQTRRTRDVIGDDHTMHLFVSLKPLSAANDQQTLVIDPWPSNQIINAEVVSYNDHFANKQNEQSFAHYSKQPAQLSKQHYMNFDFVKQNDFDLEFLNNVENMIDKKQYLDDPDWNYIKKAPTNIDIYDLMAEENVWQRFRKRLRNVKSVAKDKKQ